MDHACQNNFVIMASGNGSNAEVLAKHALKKKYPLKLVISDRQNAGVHKRMAALGIKSIIIEKSKNQEKEMISLMEENHIKWVFLAGYMRLLSPNFLKYFYDDKLNKYRVINIHPALLPSFPGMNGYRDAYDYGVEIAGVTVHFVDEGIDTGSIIAQRSFKRSFDDDFSSFCKNGLALEHELYPEILDRVMENEMVGSSFKIGN